VANLLRLGVKLMSDEFQNLYDWIERWCLKNFQKSPAAIEKEEKK